MSGLFFGTTPIVGLKAGTTDISHLYLGTTLVWSKTAVRDDFNRDDAVGLGAGWTDLGSASSPYLASIRSNTCRLNIPDGLIYVSDKVSCWRYNTAQHPGNDGYLEIRAASRGDDDDDFKTKVFRRSANASTAIANSAGVGIQLAGYQVGIVRRVAGTDTVMFSGGSFESGDVLRLVQAGNLHSLYRNGIYLGEWNDSGATAGSGAGYRSMMVSVMGEKPTIFSGRKFSAALDYVECS